MAIKSKYSLANIHLQKASDAALVAYWAASDKDAFYHMAEVRKAMEKAADVLGYALVPLDTLPAVGIGMTDKDAPPLERMTEEALQRDLEAMPPAVTSVPGWDGRPLCVNTDDRSADLVGGR